LRPHEIADTAGASQAVKIDIDARARLVAAIRKAGGQRALSREWGVSQQYICDVINGRRPISDSLLEKLGLRRTVISR
jgi:hypothetical protein